jgi:hypothetical protein
MQCFLVLILAQKHFKFCLTVGQKVIVALSMVLINLVMRNFDELVYGWFFEIYHVMLVYHIFGLAYQGKDIVFRFIIEYSGLRDFGP